MLFTSVTIKHMSIIASKIQRKMCNNVFLKCNLLEQYSVSKKNYYRPI